MKKLRRNPRHPPVLFFFSLAVIADLIGLFLALQDMLAGPLREALGRSRLGALEFACLGLGMVLVVAMIWVLPADEQEEQPQHDGAQPAHASVSSARRRIAWSMLNVLPVIAWCVMLALIAAQVAVALSGDIFTADGIGGAAAVLWFGGFMLAVAFRPGARASGSMSPP